MDDNRRTFLLHSLKSAGALGISLWLPQKGWTFSGARMRRARRTDVVFGWGENDNKSLGVALTGNPNSPYQQTSLLNWTSIVASDNVSYMLRADQTLWMVGTDETSEGLHGDGTRGAVISSITQLGTTTWRSVGTNSFSTAAVRSDGTLWAWGSNAAGTLGTGGNSWWLTTPTLYASGVKPGSISLTDWHGGYIDNSVAGNAYCFGGGDYGKLGYGVVANPSSAMMVSGTSWSAISTGCMHSFGIKNDGTLWFWGWKNNGSSGSGTGVVGISTPVNSVSGTTWKSISCGSNFSLALKTDNTLWGWGQSSFGKVGTGTTVSVSTPTQVMTGTTYKMVSAGFEYALAIKSDGTLWGWGTASSYQSGNPAFLDASTPVNVGSATTWTYISAKYNSSLGVQSDGTMWGWGSNQYCNLGDGTFNTRIAPTKIGTATNWWKVCSSYYFSAGIKTNKTLWVWGAVQTVDNEHYYFSTPVQVGSDTDWEEVKIGQYHMIIQKTNGDVYGMGEVAYQEYTSQIDRVYLLPKIEQEVSTPVQVGTSTNWASVTLGSYQAFGIQNDGTLWAWGSMTYDFNYYMGTNRFTTPTQVGTFTDWKKVYSNGMIHLGLRTNGYMYGWGAMQSGLGLGSVGTSSDISTPVRIGSLSNWTDITVADSTALALNSAGEMYSWGWAHPVQGNPSLIDRSTPVNTNSGTQWSSISAGDFHVLGLKTDGTLWAWGDGGVGQVGNGSNAAISTPVKIGTANNWRYISARNYKSFGMRR